MYCVNCGTKLAEGAKFCAECGFSGETKQVNHTTYEQPDLGFRNNKIGNALKVVGYIIAFLGFIGGFILGSQSYSFSWVTAFGWWITLAVTVVILLGLGEIVHLLSDIKANKSMGTTPHKNVNNKNSEMIL